MPLETASYISDLNSSNPAATDPLDKADDHIRLIKGAVKSTFPNVAGAVLPTHTELNYVDGVTSAIQTQLNAKQALDATLTAIAGVTTAADKGIYFTGVDTAAAFDLSAFARTLLDDTSASAMRATLGLGALSTLATVGTAEIADNSVTGAKIALGSDAAGDVMYYDGTNWVRLAAGTSGNFLKTNGAGAAPSWAAASGSSDSMTLLGSITTTSGTSQSLSSLNLTTYKKLYLVWNQVSATSAASFTLGGVTATKANGTAAGTLKGMLELDLLMGYFYSVTTGGGLGATEGATWGETSYTTASTSITVAPSAGSFDNGAIYVYGVK